MSTVIPGKVLISVLNWNSWENTCRCLDSLYMMEGSDFTVAVVDNASSEPFPDHFSIHYPHALMFQNKENVGFAQGHQTSVKWGMENGYQYFWVLNNDLIVDPNVLSALRNAIDSYGELALYGSLSIEGDPPVPINPGFLLSKNKKVNFWTSGEEVQ